MGFSIEAPVSSAEGKIRAKGVKGWKIFFFTIKVWIREKVSIYCERERGGKSFKIT